MRTEEAIVVLQELARLNIHSDTLASLPLPPYLKEILKNNESCERAHLLVLFPSLCELVVSRFGKLFSHKDINSQFLDLKFCLCCDCYVYG